jgi:hypothetical protein
MRLIFLNAMTYNAPFSRVYSNAKALSEFFESSWQLVDKNDLDRPPTNEIMLDWAEKCHRLELLFFLIFYTVSNFIYAVLKF